MVKAPHGPRNDAGPNWMVVILVAVVIVLVGVVLLSNPGYSLGID